MVSYTCKKDSASFFRIVCNSGAIEFDPAAAKYRAYMLLRGSCVLRNTAGRSCIRLGSFVLINNQSQAILSLGFVPFLERVRK